MKLPKIVRKNAHNRRESGQRRGSASQSELSDTPFTSLQQRQQPSERSPSDNLSTANPVVPSGSPRNAPSRSGSSRSAYSVHSSLPSDNGDYASDSNDGSSLSSHFSATSSFSAESRTFSGRSSTPSSSNSARINSRTFPLTNVAPISPSKQPPTRTTQYSAYARKMEKANQQRRMLASTNSAVNFDAADEFFNESDSSLGTCHDVGLSSADTAGRWRRTSSNDDGESNNGQATEEEVARRLYRSTVPTAQSMTQKETSQRRHMRKMEEAVMATRKARLHKNQTGAYAGNDKGAAAAAVAAGPVSPRTAGSAGVSHNAPPATTRNRHRSSVPSAIRTLKEQKREVVPLTATVSVAPVPSDSERRKTDSSVSSSSCKMAPMCVTEKKSWKALLGWRRKSRQSEHKSNSSDFSASREDVDSRSCRSNSNTSSETSLPGFAKRCVMTDERRNIEDGSRDTNKNNCTGVNTARVGGSVPFSATNRARTAKAALPKLSSSFTTVSDTTTAVPPGAGTPITQKKLRNLDNTQLSKLDYNARKALRTAHVRPVPPAGTGAVGACSERSFADKGGYGSFINAFDFSQDSFCADNRDANEMRSNSSRRSHNSRRSSCSHHSHSHKIVAVPPKTPSRSNGFFRSLFLSNSGTRPISTDAGKQAKENSKAAEQAFSSRQLARSPESPASDVSSGGTSLLCFDSVPSNGSNSTGVDRRVYKKACSGPAARRLRGNLPGGIRRCVDSGAQAAAVVHRDDNLPCTPVDDQNDSFGSFFNGANMPTLADPKTVTRYGGPTYTHSEFGGVSPPTTKPTEVALRQVEKRMETASTLDRTNAGKTSPLPSTTFHVNSARPTNSFPRNANPRGAAIRGSAVSGSGDNGAKTGPVLSVSALSQPSPPVAEGTNTNTNARTSTTTPASPTATDARIVCVNSSSETSNTTTSLTGDVAAGVPSRTTNGHRESGNTDSATLSYDDDFAVSSSSATAAVSASAVSGDKLSYQNSVDDSGIRPLLLDCDSTSLEQAGSRDSRCVRTQRQHGPAVDRDAVSSSTTRHPSSHTSVEGTQKNVKKSSGSSRGNKVIIAHTPPSAPSSKDLRGSDNNRHSGATAAAAMVDNSCEQGRNMVTLKPVHNSSASLLPQPPTLSNTENMNYRGGGIGGNSSNSNSCNGGGAGNSVNAAISPLQDAVVMQPTRADSKDFLLRRNHPDDTPVTIPASATAARKRHSSHESSRRHRHDGGKGGGSTTGSHRHRSRRHSNASSSRYDTSFSFSSESLLDGKARGRLAKAAAASNAASSNVERRRLLSTHSVNNNNSSGGGDGNGESTAGKRHHSHDQSSVSSRSSQHFQRSEASLRRHSDKVGGISPITLTQRQLREHDVSMISEGDSKRHRHRHRGEPRRSAEVEVSAASSTQCSRRSRNEKHGSTRRPSSGSVSSVVGLDEILQHKPMQPRNVSTSTASSAAVSSRNSSVVSSEHHGEPVGRNSVRCLRKLAAKAREASINSSSELDALGNNNNVLSSSVNKNRNSFGKNDSNTAYHPHSTTMPPVSSDNVVLVGSGLQLVRVQHSSGSGSAPSTVSALHVAGVTQPNGTGTIAATNPIDGTYAMKLPSFKKKLTAESSSSNDVSTDRAANSGGSRPQTQQLYGGGDTATAPHGQRKLATASYEGSTNAIKGSGNYILQPVRTQGSSGNGRFIHSTASGSNNNNNGGGAGGGDRVVVSLEHRKGANSGSTNSSANGVALSLAQKQHSLGGTNSAENNDTHASPFFGEGGGRSSVSSALLAQPRDSSAKRRRPATESFTPWSVDMSRFNKLRDQLGASTAATQ